MRVKETVLGIWLLVITLVPRVVEAQGSTATLSGIVRDQQNLIGPRRDGHRRRHREQLLAYRDHRHRRRLRFPGTSAGRVL